MFEKIRLILAAVLMLSGIIAGAVSILGVFRFRFVMNRMHCAAILDTLAMAGILGGLMVLTADMAYVPKLLAALLVLWVSSPAASHLVGRMELDTDDTAKTHMESMEEEKHGSD